MDTKISNKNIRVFYNKLRPHFCMVFAFASIFAVFFYISLRVPVLWDDWGRFHSSGDIMASWNFAVSYYPINGRILGNFVSLFILGHKVLFAFLSAGFFTLLTKLMAEMTQNKRVGYLIVAALIIATPITLLSEAYTWICGFGYYVFPLLTISIYLFLQKDIFITIKKTTVLNTIVGLLLGVLTQMFIENASFLAAILGSTILIISYVKHKKVSGMHIAFLLGSIIGLVIMLSSPGYATSITKPDLLSMTFIKDTFNNITGLVNHYIYICIIPIVLIGLHQIWKIQSVAKIHKIIRILLASIMSFCLVLIVFCRVSPTPIIPGTLVLILNLILIAAIGVSLILTNREPHTMIIPFLYAASIIAFLPLVLASYWGSRNFIFSYCFLIAVCGAIVNTDIAKSKAGLETIMLISCSIMLIWGSVLVLVYRDVARTETTRRNIIEQYNENPTGDVYIPNANYEEFFHGINPYFKNNNDNFHVKAYKSYFGIPDDTNIHYN